MWYIYIVRCSDDSLYTGITNNIKRRIKEHNGYMNKGARYTKSKQPVTLVYSEVTKTRSMALTRELAIKKLTHAQKTQLI